MYCVWFHCSLVVIQCRSVAVLRISEILSFLIDNANAGKVCEDSCFWSMLCHWVSSS
jgi:hypothetical protein